ncbi:hypothetical protein [Hathewaya massiliensis]|uniref:hypothetical protein n=1 Tax=Hathewaya massiliensis TaxID=1964382 RepID=UPI0011586849|nr:hypothetical protein [Hathewaya massiliensis]
MEVKHKLIDKYSKEEFKFIISLLPHSELIEPIKKYSKEYSKDIKGFRPDNLSTLKLKNIYYSRIYIKRDQCLIRHIEKLIKIYLKEVDKIILEKLTSDEIIKIKLQENDIKYFDEFIDALLETKYKNNINLYFKMIDHELTEEQINYLNSEYKDKILHKEIETEVKNDLSIKYESKLKEIEKSYTTKLEEKEFQIKILEEKLQDEKKFYEFELENKNLSIKELNQNHNRSEEKLLVEVRKLRDKIDRLELSAQKLKVENDEKDKQIIVLSEWVNSKYDKFNEVANVRWIKENKNLLKERAEIDETLQGLRKNKEELLSEINSLNLSKNDLKKKLVATEEKSRDFILNMREMLNTIGFDKQQTITKQESKIHRISSKVLDGEKELIDKDIEFIEDLSDNLQSSGIKNKYSFELAQYIYAILSNKMSLLLSGCNSRKITEAISYLINGASTEVIVLPLGYNDPNELIREVDNSTGKVVLIENAVDNISESIYLSLIKENTNKIIIFSMESSENISILPKSIFNYMTLVDVDILLGYGNSGELLTGVCNENIFNIDMDEKFKSENLRQISRLDNAINLSNCAKFRLAEIMSIIDELKLGNKAISCILMFSVYPLCKCNDTLKELREYIEKQGISAEEFKRLQAILGDIYDKE